MKKSLIFGVLFLFVLFASVQIVSSEVSLGSSVNEVYNLGDVVKLPISISSDQDLSDLFVLSLVCGEGKVEFYKEYIYLSSGEVASKTVYVPLIKDLINNLEGECSISYSLGSEENTLAEEFFISDKILFEIDNNGESFSPGESLNLRGTATKENGNFFEGTLNVFIEGGNSEDISFDKEVNSDSFNLEIILPENFEAGTHLVSFDASEIGVGGKITNTGHYEFFIDVAQVPTNLELVFEEKSVSPGSSVIFKAILHDQTGEKIDSKAYFAVRDPESEILKKYEGKTGEAIEYKINSTELPGVWSISAYALDLNQRETFNIREKESVKVEILNETLLVTNDGNVPYNGTLEVEIGDQKLDLEVILEYGEFAKYKLTAPKGTYEISVEGVTKQVSLTGRAVDAKKISSSAGTGTGNIILWIFVILILGFILYIIISKGYKRAFFGKLKRFPLPASKKKKGYKEISAMSAASSSSGFSGNLIKPKLPSEISLSIKGSKQNAGLICLNLKNYSEISEGQGSSNDTLSKIISLVESSKGFVFSNNGSLFFIFAPSRTKTFRNESMIISISEKIKDILKEHNKKFKVKIDFGLALNYGTIVTKEEGGKMKFMSMGTLMSDSRKLANLSKESVLISEKVKERLGSEVKTETKDFGNTKVYTIREIIDKNKHNTFIKGFIARQERDRMKQGK